MQNKRKHSTRWSGKTINACYSAKHVLFYLHIAISVFYIFLLLSIILFLFTYLSLFFAVLFCVHPPVSFNALKNSHNENIFWWLHIYFTLSMIFPRTKKVINYIYFIVTNAPAKRWMVWYIWETAAAAAKNAMEIPCQGKCCWWFFIFTFDSRHHDLLDQFIEMGKLFLTVMWRRKKRIKLIKIDHLFGKEGGYFIRQLTICSLRKWCRNSLNSLVVILLNLSLSLSLFFFFETKSFVLSHQHSVQRLCYNFI